LILIFQTRCQRERKEIKNAAFGCRGGTEVEAESDCNKNKAALFHISLFLNHRKGVCRVKKLLQPKNVQITE